MTMRRTFSTKYVDMNGGRLISILMRRFLFLVSFFSTVTLSLFAFWTMLVVDRAGRLLCGDVLFVWERMAQWR